METGGPRGFTLVELLAVIAIIGLLAGLLLPAVQRARESGRRAACANKLAQLGKACLVYASVNGAYPAAFTSQAFSQMPMQTYTGSCGPFNFGNDQSPSWTIAILPFLGQQPRFDSFRPRESGGAFDGAYVDWILPNQTAAYTPNSAYQCPSDPVSESWETNTNYFGVSGGGAWSAPPAGKSPKDGYAWFKAHAASLYYNNGIIHINGRVTEGAILDGTSNTFMVGETRYQWVLRSEQAWDPATKPTGNWLWVNRASRPSWAGGSRAWKCTAGASLIVASTQASTSQYGINNSPCTDMLKSPPLPPSPCSDVGAAMVSSFGSFHPGGCHFALADGAVKFIDEMIDITLYRRLGQKADGVLMSGLPW